MIFSLSTFFTLAVGHYNHSNISVSGTVTGGILGGLIGLLIVNGLLDIHILSTYSLTSQLLALLFSIAGGAFLLGPVMKYLFNSPEMHIWHHAYDLPEERKLWSQLRAEPFDLGLFIRYGLHSKKRSAHSAGISGNRTFSEEFCKPIVLWYI